MGDGTEQNPYTREDVLKLIEENGGTAEGLNLSRATFVEAIDLSGLDLHGIILKEAKFPTRFKDEIVEGADLRGSHLKKADLTKAHLERAELHETHLEGANLRDAHLEGAFLWDTHLEGANLMSTHLQGANLMRTKFSPDVSLESVDWGNYILGEEKDGYFDAAVDTYRRLKAWYSQSGYGDTAGKFYYREKEANRKRLKLLSKDWHHRIASEVIRALFGYGERWWNIVFSIETLILLFAFTYLAIAASWEWQRILLIAWIPGLIVWFVYLKFTTGLNWTWWKKAPFWVIGMGLLFFAFYFLSGLVPSQYVFWRYLYFSTVSFTALGYGGWVILDFSLADDVTKGIGAFESLMGISMMALLLVTFVRKWTR